MKLNYLNLINSFLFCGTVFYLYSINKIGYFINSQYYTLLIISIIFVAISTCIFGYFLVTKKNYHHNPVSIFDIIFTLTLVVLFASLFIMPLKPLSVSSNAFASRKSSRQETQKNNFVAKSADIISNLSIVDWVRTIEESPSAMKYNKQKVNIRGIVSKSIQNGFEIGIYKVSCCVVDAQLTTIPIVFSGQIPTQDTWVSVDGSIEIIGQKPNFQYRINATNVKITDVPANPYQTK